MISREDISAASSVIDEVTILSITAIVSTSDAYISAPAYYSDLAERLEAVDGTNKAKQINAALDALETLGIGEVEINQAQTVGTDGLVYSQNTEREALIAYLLGVLYKGQGSSVYIDEDTWKTLRGAYAVGRLPLDYSEGYL